MERPIRFAVIGFVRIGRALVRQWMRMEASIVFDLVAINDIAPIETCAHFLEYDSVYGLAPAKIAQAACALILKGHSVRFTQQHYLGSVDMSGVDVVLLMQWKSRRFTICLFRATVWGKTCANIRSFGAFGCYSCVGSQRARAEGPKNYF